MNGTGSGSRSMAGFGISGADSFGSTTRNLKLLTQIGGA